ncbi:hypothetical protein BKA56DRAFT_665904 [Ilyonectria sp. MPI-CAGE-AT-0026]|nr:hypothetical protein BKA56DRAFT_665904 [Ilyonectria sp. MPI-CAGE-AT-0026]
MSTDTSESPRLSKDGVIGFADAPYPREPSHTTIDAVEPVRDATVGSVIEPARVQVFALGSEDNTPAPRIESCPPSKVHLSGWRKHVHSGTTLSAMTVPWISGMIVSWMPLTRISLREAPGEVLVNMIASTIEVSAIAIVLVSITLRTWLDPSFASRPACGRPFAAMIFILFLGMDPLVTGGVVWARVNMVPCQKGSGSAQCRVGDDLLRAIGAFRAIGVFGTFCLGCFIANQVSKAMEHGLLRRRQKWHV